MLEAMASGVPVAAHPVTGPIDVVVHGVTGILDEDLGVAARKALALDPHRCIQFARTRTWGETARAFVDLLASAAEPTMRSYR